MFVDGVSQSAITNVTFNNVIANHTIVASFAINTFTVTPSVTGGSGTINPSTQLIVSYGSNAAFAITPSVGYYLSSLSVDGSSVATSSTYTFTNVTANHAIAAIFSANTYTITASAGANGSISPTGAYSVSSGGTATFTITPAANYHVADVVVDGASKGVISSFTFTNVIANHAIAASFAINTFTVTPSVTGGSGSINPSTQQVVSYGSNTAFTMTPNAGYYLSNLSVDGSSVATASTYTFTDVTANQTINALFTSLSTTINAGVISADTTWTLAGSPYVVTGFVQVYGTPTAPVTLTIEPGVVVKFIAGAGMQIGYSTSQGALIARGTSANRILFTRSGTSGNWSTITFNDGTVDALLCWRMSISSTAAASL